KIGSATLECPVRKGAIWVHVRDEMHKGIELQVIAPGSKRTDTSGFAAFDPLDPGTYTVEIDTSSLGDEYFPPAEKDKKIENVPVRTGEITLVEFQIERVAPLTVLVNYPKGFPEGLDIQATASSNEFAPRSAPLKGKYTVKFRRLRRHDYT